MNVDILRRCSPRRTCATRDWNASPNSAKTSGGIVNGPMNPSRSNRWISSVDSMGHLGLDGRGDREIEQLAWELCGGLESGGERDDDAALRARFVRAHDGLGDVRGLLDRRPRAAAIAHAVDEMIDDAAEPPWRGYALEAGHRCRIICLVGTRSKVLLAALLTIARHPAPQPHLAGRDDDGAVTAVDRDRLVRASRRPGTGHVYQLARRETEG